jgi:hypothetical protein
MILDVSALSATQITILTAWFAAIIAGTFGIVTALVSGWNARQQNRAAALREYRLKSSEELLDIVRFRLNTVFRAHLREWVPPHTQALQELFPEHYNARTVISFRMSSPFALRNMALRFQAREAEFYKHVKTDKGGHCELCEFELNHLGVIGAALHDMLERFIFYGRTPNRYVHRLKWWYIERRYQKMLLKNNIIKVTRWTYGSDD